MRFLRDLPISRKFIVVAVFTSGVALLLACVVFALYEQAGFRRSMMRDFAIIADMFDDNVASGLAFDDAAAIEQTLKTLSAHPRILAACVFNRSGLRVAQYERADLAASFAFPEVRGNGQVLGADRLDTYRTIVLAGETIGAVYIGSDLSELNERLWRYASMDGLLLLVCSLVALALASKLQKFISEPIVALEKTIAAVTAGKNYSMRAVRQGDDEVGRLVDGFNTMLAQIQERDAELQKANDNLEKRVEERTAALKQSQVETARERARFKFIFESVPVGISMVVGTSGNRIKLLINDAHLSICGITREQAEESGTFERLSYPDDYERQTRLFREVNEGSIRQFSLEKRYLRPDGKTVWVAFSFQRRDYDDGTHEGVSTVVDITTLKQAREEAAQKEAQLRFIFEALPVGVTWIYRHSDRIAHMINASFYRISGLSETTAISLEHVRNITPADDLKRQDELRARLDRGEIDDFSIEKRYRHPNGKVVWVVLTIKVYRGSDRRIQQEVCTVVDITERKQAEAERETLNRQLLDTSRQAGMAEVATGVLHNVGNVLNSVNVSANLVIDEIRGSKVDNVGKVAAMINSRSADLGAFLANDPKGRMIPGYLAELGEKLVIERKIVTTELEHLRKHIEHIKDIVAMQQNFAKVSGVKETVALSDLVEDAVRMNASALSRHGVEVVRDYAARPTLVLERHKVVQVLVNLIRNAKQSCQQARQSDSRIILRLTQEGKRARITVIDNGVGIPPENLKLIFSHGFTTRKDGHGFGLHSSALVAKELGGSLSAHSDGPGRGAIFTLELVASDENYLS